MLYSTTACWNGPFYLEDWGSGSRFLTLFRRGTSPLRQYTLLPFSLLVSCPWEKWWQNSFKSLDLVYEFSFFITLHFLWMVRRNRGYVWGLVEPETMALKFPSTPCEEGFQVQVKPILHLEQINLQKSYSIF